MGKVLGSIGETLVPRLWHKCFRPVARLFLTDDITVLSIRKKQTENNRFFGLIHVNDCDMHCELS